MSTSLFAPPAGLVEVAHFTVPRVQTWGDGKLDAPYRELVRQSAKLHQEAAQEFGWFVFHIRCTVSQRRKTKRGPDVENIPKLIVDAFTGILYPDDNLDHVRGLQVEAIFGPDNDEIADITIYGSRVVRPESDAI